MKVVTLVGARPQFIKASMVSRAFAAQGVEEVIVHSGQHYDHKVSQIFFEELEIPAPYANLQVGSGTHAIQTGQIMERFEGLLMELGHIDAVLVYGDTNTTLAGAIVASKLHIPIAHVEAGLRSFNRQMPEEVNRVMTDHVSAYLFCPTDTSVENLQKEGITKGVHLIGDVMYDATAHFSTLAESKLSPGEVASIADKPYYLATVHRASNTDNPDSLREIFAGFGKLSAPVVLPLHPRTKSKLSNISIPANVKIQEPAGYLQMLTLIKHAEAVLTDSGGLQKEAFWLKKPCITLRRETEWVETLIGGWNQLVMADRDAIKQAVEKRPAAYPQKIFGLPPEGTASNLIAEILVG